MLIIKDSKRLNSFVLNECKLYNKPFDHDWLPFLSFPSISLVSSFIALPKKFISVFILVL